MTTLMECESSLDHTDVFGHTWEGRRVSVVGLGRSGLAAAQLLCRLGCRVRVTDDRTTPTLEAARGALESWGVEEVEIGGHTRRFIDDAEFVVVSPGVPETTGPIQWALEQRVPILSEIELAFHFCSSPIVAVTGTNGKSTVVTLIADLLQASGRSAVACGNLGIPFSSVVDQLTFHPVPRRPRLVPTAGWNRVNPWYGVHTIAVVEVSSFQLLWCERFRPKISVLLNIGTNHLDRHLDHRAYLAAKAKLLREQIPEDWAVLNGRDPHIVAMAEHCHAQQVWFGDNRSNPASLRLAPETLDALPESAQVALQVGRLMGIPDPLIYQVIRSFRGLEHRRESVATLRGIHVVNDSKSTTPDSLFFALSHTRGDVVVILGGRDKGLDFHRLVGPLSEERIQGVVLIGEARARLRTLLEGATTIREAQTLDEAVRFAFELARPGTTVLFSPACASFDMFRDFEERGRVFKAIVHQLDHKEVIG